MKSEFIFDRLLKDPIPKENKFWIQNPSKIEFDGRFRANEKDRFYVDLYDPNYANRFNNLMKTTFEYMEYRLGGYPDRYDPLPIKLINNDEQGGGHIYSGSVCINGRCQSGTGKNALRGLIVEYNFPNSTPHGYTVYGYEMKLPVRAAVPLNWTAINETDFERLIYRLFALNDEFDFVQWLQKTKAPDAGRDISAIKIKNKNRVLIQAKHAT